MIKNRLKLKKNIKANCLKKEKKYRPNVAAVILSSKYPLECKIMIARRNDMHNIWQFPQGGIDEGEKPIKALLRELKEEIGTDEVELIDEYPNILRYDFPKNTKCNFHYDGQEQKYFLLKLKNQAIINLKTPKPEFDLYEFVSIDDFFKRINYFKKPIYTKVIKYFQNKGYL